MTPQQYLDLFPADSDTIDWNQFDYPHLTHLLKTTPFDWQSYTNTLPQLTERLKWLADQAMYGNVHPHCWAMADLLTLLAEKSGRYEPLDCAYRARANYFAHGEVDYEKAIGWCGQAEMLCRTHNNEIGVAYAQITKIWPLTALGNQKHALNVAEQARIILHKHKQWHKLADLLTNIGALCFEILSKHDEEILAYYDEALALYTHIQSHHDIPSVQNNRAICLTNLGRFSEAKSILKTIIAQLAEMGHTAEEVRAEMNLGVLHFVQGNYTQAMRLFEQTRVKFAGRPHEAAHANLHMLHCLLEIRRFRQVNTLCPAIIEYFESVNLHSKAREAALSLAISQAALYEYEQALQTLSVIYRQFMEQNQQRLAMTVQLEQAAIYLRAGQLTMALTTATRSFSFFSASATLIPTARAQLIMAEAAFKLGNYHDALQWLTHLQQLETPILSIQLQTTQLLAELMWHEKRYEDARITFERALQLLEQWQSRLMIELRSDFLIDRQVVYESSIQLALQVFTPELAFTYVERAKSRALVDLFAQHISVRMQARDANDQVVIDQIHNTRERRDQLYRQLASPEQDETAQHQIRTEIIRLESTIQANREILLNRNADYVHDMALTHVLTEGIQQYLASDTILVEYFVVNGQYVTFVVSATAIKAYPLSATCTEIQRLQKSLQLDFRTVARGRKTQRGKKLLHTLYQKLWLPFAPIIKSYEQIIVVPHGTLHYLPFHALHNGTGYLIEQTAFSYLPNATMLRYLPPTTTTTGALVMGNSWEEHLPYAVREAHAVATQTNANCFVDDEANRHNFYQYAPTSRLIHLATHGEFSVENPLFSRLVLADGDVTTLDLLEMRLEASLVVLSACETGRAVIGGGDELLGFIRALLYAGASSLVLTLWCVEDMQTQALMSHFYHYLQDAQKTKERALQMAQCRLIEAGIHPFYWAAFTLIGRTGQF